MAASMCVATGVGGMSQALSPSLAWWTQWVKLGEQVPNMLRSAPQPFGKYKEKWWHWHFLLIKNAPKLWQTYWLCSQFLNLTKSLSWANRRKKKSQGFERKDSLLDWRCPSLHVMDVKDVQWGHLQSTCNSHLKVQAHLVHQYLINHGSPLNLVRAYQSAIATEKLELASIWVKLATKTVGAFDQVMVPLHPDHSLHHMSMHFMQLTLYWNSYWWSLFQERVYAYPHKDQEGVFIDNQKHYISFCLLCPSATKKSREHTFRPASHSSRIQFFVVP